MTQDFTSVTLFYVALRDLLLADAGLTIERTLGPTDVILTGAGALLRLRKVTVSSTVSAVSMEFGTDPEVLSVSTKDPELCLPFDTSAVEPFYANLNWIASVSVLELLIAPNSTSPGLGNTLRVYRVDANFATKCVTVLHQDPPLMVYAPNFKQSGGPYIQAGA